MVGDPGCPSLQFRILPKATVIQTQAKLCPVSCSAPQLQMWQDARGWGQQEDHRDQRGSRLASQAPEGEACNPLLHCSWVPTSRVSPQLARPEFTQSLGPTWKQGWFQALRPPLKLYGARGRGEAQGRHSVTG